MPNMTNNDNENFCERLKEQLRERQSRDGM
jgi:hypothetical protein